MKQNAIAATAFLAALIIASLIIIQPRFVGLNCDGKIVPQFAQYESQFPRCGAIQPIFN